MPLYRFGQGPQAHELDVQVVRGMQEDAGLRHALRDALRVYWGLDENHVRSVRYLRTDVKRVPIEGVRL